MSQEEKKPKKSENENTTEEQKNEKALEENSVSTEKNKEAGEKSEQEKTTKESSETTTETPKNQEEERAEKDQAIPEEFDKKAKTVECPHKNINSGMVVRVHEVIKDTNSRGEEKTRTQVFEGVVIGIKGSGPSRTMTVRKNSKGWMVEKIFPLSSPVIEKIEVVKKYKNRRAKMTFLRGRFRRKLKEQK